jgi:hypothetical protein
MTCLAPGCGGVIELHAEAEKVNPPIADQGECKTCQVRHRRLKGSANWDQIVGPVIVTVDGTTFATTTASNNTRDLVATDVRFDTSWVILDGDLTFNLVDLIRITTAP